MNLHRLLRAATSCLIVTTLCVVPWNVALAAPEESDAAAEEPTEDEPADGEAAPEAEGDEETADDEASAEGESETPDEGEEGAEGEEGEEAPAEDEAPAEEEPAAEDGAEAPPVEEAPPEPEGPERPDEPRWGKENQHPLKGTGMIIAGTASTILGAAFIGLAFGVTKCDEGTEPGCANKDNRTLLVPSAITATGTGLLLLGVGLGMRKKYKNWENWSPEQAMVAPAIYEGGGGVAVTGRF